MKKVRADKGSKKGGPAIKRWSAIILTGAMLLLLQSAVLAAVPEIMTYQGRLVDDTGEAQNGSFNMEFKLYNVESGGSALWTEAISNVPVTDGRFNVILGETTPVPSAEFTGQDLWLGINVAADGEMVPRMKVTTVGYAFRAYSADTLDGTDPSGFVEISGDTMTGSLTIGAYGQNGHKYLRLETGSGNQWNNGVEFMNASAGYGFTIQSNDVNSPYGLRIKQHSGDTAGVTRIFINRETGLIGMGTLTPEATLHVAGDVTVESDMTILGDLYIHGTIEGLSDIDLKGTLNITEGDLNIINGLIVGGVITGDGSALTGVGGGLSTAEADTFYVNVDGDTMTGILTVEDAAHLATSAGNVGIGTNGPDKKLDILDAAAAQLRLTHTDSSVYTDMQTDSNGKLNITPTSKTVEVHADMIVGAGASYGMLLASSHQDNFTLATYTNVEYPNYYIGIGNGSGAHAGIDTTKGYIKCWDGGIKMQITGMSDFLEMGPYNNIKISAPYHIRLLGSVEAGNSDNNATGSFSIALGTDNDVTGQYSTAIGWKNTNNGYSSIAMGTDALVDGNYSVGICLADTTPVSVVSNNTLSIHGGTGIHVNIGTHESIGGLLNVHNNNSSDDSYLDVRLGAGNSNVRYGYTGSSYSDATYGEGTMFFENNMGDTRFMDSGVTRMVIDTEGKVGIATAEPASQLHVVGTIETTGVGGIKFQDGTTQITAATGGGGGLSTAEADTFYVNVDGDTMTSVLTIDSSANVPLDFYRASGNQKITMRGGSFGSDIHQVNLRPNNNYGAAITAGGGYSLRFTSFNEYDPFYFTKWDGSSLSNLVIIETDGDVGIGTDSPSALLDVDGNVAFGLETGSSTDTYVDIVHPDDSQASIRLENYGGGSTGGEITVANDNSFILNNPLDLGTDPNLSFRSSGSIDIRMDENSDETDRIIKFSANGAGTELMRINESGQIGVGIDAPASNVVMHVSNTVLGSTYGTRVRLDEPTYDAHLELARAGDVKWAFSTNNDNFFLYCPTATADVIKVMANGAQDNTLVVSGGAVGIGTANPETDLHVEGDLKVTGWVTIDGNVGIGTTEPTEKLVVQDSNYVSYLGDYNWYIGPVPNPHAAIGASNGTASGYTGYYFSYMGTTQNIGGHFTNGSVSAQLARSANTAYHAAYFTGTVEVNGDLILGLGTTTRDRTMKYDGTNEDLSIGDGTNSQIVHMGEWKSYTPTIGGAGNNKGSGTVNGRYTQVGKTVIAYIQYVLAADSTLAAGITISLPVSAQTSGMTTWYPMGQGFLYDSNAGTYFQAYAGYGSASAIYVGAWAAGGVYTGLSGITAAAPFTWTTSDAIYLKIMYEAQ
ncbi:hypothetical protein ACFLZ2_01045 [Candidatus Margulisiibacteriota bacterium]